MSSGWGRINGNAFRAQVSLDLSRALDALNATVPERVVLGYVREQSWNRAVVRKASPSEPWPDPLPASVDVTFLAERTGLAVKAIEHAVESLRKDRLLIPYKGGLTVNKNADQWAQRRISRPALEYARSAQAIHHPGANGTAYPGPAGKNEELPPNPSDPAAHIATWMESEFGKALPAGRLRELVETGHHVAWITEAIRRAVDRARKRTVGGVTAYALSCLDDWKSKGRTQRMPESFRSEATAAARSPPSAPRGQADKESFISQCFAQAAEAEADDGDDDDEEEEATDG